MYLLISDYFKIDNNQKEYLLCNQKYYDEVLKIFPQTLKIHLKEIEGIIIYSIRKEDNDKQVIECSCLDYSVNSESIRIKYGQTKKTEITCKQIKKSLFGLLKRKGLLNNANITPLVALVDINEYNNIIYGQTNPQIISIMTKIESLKSSYKWKEIINIFGDINNIEKLDCWSNNVYLNEIIFALSKIIEPGNKKFDFKEKSNLQNIFYKAVNKSLEKEPNNQTIKSILAYHYYLYFMNEKNNSHGYYDKANELYLDLIESSNDKFKEKYRFWKLQQINFDIIKWNLKDDWIKNVNRVLDGFKNLIQEYKKLSEENQKKRKKEYIGSLYAYSVFAIENFFKIWEAYVDDKIFNKPISKYILTQDRFQMIIEVSDYLKEIVQISGYEEKGNNIDLRQKPSYIDVLYRQAQIEQVKGIIYVIKNHSQGEYNQYFNESNLLLEKLFNLAKKAKENSKILFPHYAKETRAQNNFFLNNEQMIHCNFNNAKPYMLYEEAIIYCLQNNYDAALQTLNKIPENDTCYKKSILLKERISHGNK